MKLLSQVSALCLLLLGLTGCASYTQLKPYPANEQAVQPQLNEASLSRMTQIPAGSYYDETHRIVFTGHQAGLMTSAALFGPIGAIVASNANEAHGESTYSNSIQALEYDLAQGVMAAIDQQIVSQNSSRIVTQGGSNTLSIQPYALVARQSAGDSIVTVSLLLKVTNPAGLEVWKGLISATADETLIFRKEGQADRQSIEAALKQACQRAAWGLVKDFNGGFTGERKVLMASLLTPDKYNLKGVILGEENGLVIYRLIVPDNTMFGGVQIMPEKWVHIKDADFTIPGQ